MKPSKKLIRCFVFSVAILTGSQASRAAISITAFNSPLTENFDILANSGTSSTLPSGWAFSEAGSNADPFYTGGTGSSLIGDTYSFGPAANTERAFGGLQTSTLLPTIGVEFVNNTGSQIDALVVSYTGEQWRRGENGGSADRLDFQYKVTTGTLTDGTWTDVNDLDFNSPWTTTLGARDGNAVGNQTALSFTITGLSIADGGTVWFRWTDFNAAGSDDGLAIDDFSITAVPEPVNVALTCFAILFGGCMLVRRWYRGSAMAAATSQ